MWTRSLWGCIRYFNFRLVMIYSAVKLLRSYNQGNLYVAEAIYLYHHRDFDGARFPFFLRNSFERSKVMPMGVAGVISSR